MKKVLVVEDEEGIRSFEVISLKMGGYETSEAVNGADAVRQFMAAPDEFGVVTLDIMMPEMDGIEACRRIREISKKVGIIMISAKAQESDKVIALGTGADDYIVKPFATAEFLARVDALFRRVSNTMEEQKAQDVLESGPFKLSLVGHTLTKNGKLIDLTQVEFQLMEYFMSNEETALERKQILVKIWGESYEGDEKIVDVNIRRLRMKIEEDPSNPLHLQTVWGFGYKWVPAF